MATGHRIGWGIPLAVLIGLTAAGAVMFVAVPPAQVPELLGPEPALVADDMGTAAPGEGERAIAAAPADGDSVPAASTVPAVEEPAAASEAPAAARQAEPVPADADPIAAAVEAAVDETAPASDAPAAARQAEPVPADADPIAAAVEAAVDEAAPAPGDAVAAPEDLDRGEAPEDALPRPAAGARDDGPGTEAAGGAVPAPRGLADASEEQAPEMPTPGARETSDTVPDQRAAATPADLAATGEAAEPRPGGPETPVRDDPPAPLAGLAALPAPSGERLQRERLPLAPAAPSSEAPSTAPGDSAAITAPRPSAAPERQPSRQSPSPPAGAPAIEPAPAIAVPEAPGEPPAAAAEPLPDVLSPSFDVVRVAPEGTAVLAGRAAPGATVEVRDGGTVLGTASADARGEWVILPDAPLNPGTSELSIVAELPGQEPVPSEDLVVLVVPQRQQPEDAAADRPPLLAVKVSRDAEGPSRLLQLGTPDTNLSASGGLTLDTIDYDEAGRIDLGGRAIPGNTIGAYLNNKLIGTAQAAESGRWHLSPSEPIAPGLHLLRIDQIDTGGKVISRIETPFSQADLATMPASRDGVVIVQPGNSLWRISRQVYGEGVRYTLIFEANRYQIVDPDLIYPGQVFVIPGMEQS